MTGFLLLLVLLLAAAFGLPHSEALFVTLFPGIANPVWRQDPFPALLLGHLWIVALSSAVSILLGVGMAVFATRPVGREFRGLLETIAAVGQAFPPVAVLALAVPALGFGAEPALIALALYGLLPVVQNTLAGLDRVPAQALLAGRGMGMSPAQILLRVELPLAAPALLAGMRISVVIGTGTAAIASTVGARTLGLPIIVGLNAGNTAYVLQGALLVALMAITFDALFEALARSATRWRRAA